MQIAPLSFAVPASAATFVLETILAKLVLHEHVGKRRTAGTLLVLGGVILLAKQVEQLLLRSGPAHFQVSKQF